MTVHDAVDGFDAPPKDSVALAALCDRSGTCVYEVFLRGHGTGRLIWNVSEASGEEFTVALRYELDGETFDTTVSGGAGGVTDRLLATPARPFLLVAFSPSALLLADGDTLSVGDRLYVSRGEETGSAEITSTFAHAGTECYTAAWRHGDELRQTNCVAPDAPLVFRADYYERGDTDPLLGVVLVEERSK